MGKNDKLSCKHAQFSKAILLNNKNKSIDMDDYAKAADQLFILTGFRPIKATGSIYDGEIIKEHLRFTFNENQKKQFYKILSLLILFKFTPGPSIDLKKIANEKKEYVITIDPVDFSRLNNYFSNATTTVPNRMLPKDIPPEIEKNIKKIPFEREALEKIIERNAGEYDLTHLKMRITSFFIDSCPWFESLKKDGVRYVKSYTPSYKDAQKKKEEQLQKTTLYSTLQAAKLRQ